MPPPEGVGTTAATVSDRPDTYWTASGGNGGDFTALLLNGGFTVRAGAWPGDQPDIWGGAATATLITSAGHSGQAWAVEIGWLSGGMDGNGEDGGVEGGEAVAGVSPRWRREVITTVIDAKAMAPLGVWRGSETR